MPAIIEISQSAHELWRKMLEKGGPIKNADLKILMGKAVPPAATKELKESGLVKVVKEKPVTYQANPSDPATQVKIKSTQTTIKLSKPVKPRPKPEPTPSFGEIMEQVGKYCQPYFERIEELTGEVAELKKIITGFNKGGPAASIAQKSAPPKLNPEPVAINRFYETLRRTCIQLDDKSRYGGEIPLPEIWNMMNTLNLNLTWDAFQDLLRKLEDERRIDLHIANDPSQVRFPEKGFTVPGRGFVYYVALRS